MKNVGINGFGRIGRLVFRAIVEQGLLGKDLAVVALNDLVPADNLAYLVKYDSTQGRFQAEISSAKSRPDLHDASRLGGERTTRPRARRFQCADRGERWKHPDHRRYPDSRESTYNRAVSKALPDGGVLLVENVRFFSEEEANADSFAQELPGVAALADR
jgi:hypothetical protein